jgi:antirestriction protein ArdC
MRRLRSTRESPPILKTDPAVFVRSLFFPDAGGVSCDACHVTVVVEKYYDCPIWMTYKQAQELNAQVRKGEHGSLVVYADKITRTELDLGGEEAEREIHFMKGYTVFNCEQIEGLPSHFYATAAPRASTIERIAAAEKFAASTNATLRVGGNRAYYSVTDDYVQIPPLECFADAEGYYSTLLHELTHNADTRIMPRRVVSAPESQIFRRCSSA